MGNKHSHRAPYTPEKELPYVSTSLFDTSISHYVSYRAIDDESVKKETPPPSPSKSPSVQPRDNDVLSNWKLFNDLENREEADVVSILFSFLFFSNLDFVA